MKPGNIILVNSSELDREDVRKIGWAQDLDIDYISFRKVNNAKDLEELGNMISNISSQKKLASAPSRYASIELDSLIKMSDGLIINRGLLSLEVPLSEICQIQKTVIGRCKDLHRPVIVAA